MKIFLVAGNKRSGTSLLVRLLNLHPEVFCSHESDIAWAMFQMAYSLDVGVEDLVHHFRDDEHAMLRSMETIDLSLITSQRNPRQAFIDATLDLMRKGNRIQDAFPGKHPTAVGDKKPYQYADPDVRPWLDEALDPIYLHSVRHPRECIRSMHETGLIGWWRKPLEEVGDIWAEHERWALSIDEDRRLTYRYEDLLDDPAQVMRSVFSRLGLSMPASVTSDIRRRVKPQRPRAEGVEVPYTDSMREIMELHGYQP